VAGDGKIPGRLIRSSPVKKKPLAGLKQSFRLAEPHWRRRKPNDPLSLSLISTLHREYGSTLAYCRCPDLPVVVGVGNRSGAIEFCGAYKKQFAGVYQRLPKFWRTATRNQSLLQGS
jgi:hypothetical protein